MEKHSIIQMERKQNLKTGKTMERKQRQYIIKMRLFMWRLLRNYCE